MTERLNLWFSGAQESIHDEMTLAACESFDLTALTSPQDYMQASNSAETIQALEELLAIWIKQISEVHCHDCY